MGEETVAGTAGRADPPPGRGGEPGSMPPLDPFAMERWQSTYETAVAYNLSESGILPVTLASLVDHSWIREVLARQPLGYGHTRGSPELRAAIASLYPDAHADQVLVTTGTAEANFLATWWLVEPGDEVVLMLPNYMQIHGLVRGFGGQVQSWSLRAERGWRPDPAALDALVTKRTKAVVICNPNNPTGAVLTAEEMEAAVRAAARAGAWVVADEVYRGAEVVRDLTPTFLGRADRVLVTGGLSKAYGLPGLRIGWIVGPRDALEALMARHDYTTIGPAYLSDMLARVALSSRVHARLAQRARLTLQSNLGLVMAWVTEQEGRVTWTPPEAGAIAMLRYRAAVNSTALAERLRVEQDVLVVPGDHFGLDGFIRIGYGLETSVLEEGLRRIGTVLRAL
ncbi:MAG: aminotransferase class I/II-fold pyridoxal phosphate-dependent enzyme [Armatimonadetes bacterium]|nr:aminotransferase class I/II-fold pyridoxal phosphate-dependent enzyme [Armatimonadota bacterium]